MDGSALMRKALTFVRNIGHDQFRRIVRAKKYLERKMDVEKKVLRLKAELAKWSSRLGKLEGKIRQILGGAKRGRASAKRGGSSLQEVLMAVLRAAKQPLRLSELAKTVLKAGYKTGSTFKGFRTTVAHALQKLRTEIRKIGRAYTMGKKAKPSPTPAKKAGRRKGTPKVRSRKPAPSPPPSSAGSPKPSPADGAKA